MLTIYFYHLENLELDGMLHIEMTVKIKETYLKSVKLILKSNLNERSLVIVMNVWTVAVNRNSAYIKWTKKEIIELDRNSRDLMTLYGCMALCTLNQM